MKNLTALLPALLLTGALGASSLPAAAAADPSGPPPPPADGGAMGPMGDHPGHGMAQWQGHGNEGHWRQDHRSPLMHLLHKLDLSDAQKGQVRAIFEKSRTDMEALGAKGRATHESLAGLSPKDPSFGTLVESAKANAAARVQLYADEWTRIYGVLTPAQQAKIPAVLAEEKSARAAHEAEWKAHHEESKAHPEAPPPPHEAQ